MRLGHAGIVDYSVDLSIPDFFDFFYIKVLKERGREEWREAIKKIYKCITANTSATWHHTTHQLTSPSS